METEPRRSPEDIKALAFGAKELIEDPAFTAAVRDLRKQLFDELTQIQERGLRQDELCSMLRVLDLLTQRLVVLVNDYRFLKKPKANA